MASHQRITHGAISQIIPASRPKHGSAGYAKHNHTNDDGLVSALRAARRAEKKGATFFEYRKYLVVLCQDGKWREWGAASPKMIGRMHQHDNRDSNRKRGK